MLYVQDLVRVTGSDDGCASGRFFYTYNQCIENHLFASRPGFVQAKMKYQGMVGVMGDGGKTRLTWLVNMDFGGLLPSSFMDGVLVAVMSYPFQILEGTKMYFEKKQEDEGADIAKSSPGQGSLDFDSVSVSRDEALEELKEKLKRSEKTVEELRGELTASLREKDRELDRALEEKDKELERALEKKDKELEYALAENLKTMTKFKQRSAEIRDDNARGESRGDNIKSVVLLGAYEKRDEKEEGAGNGVALEGNRETAVELKLRTELAEMKAEMVRKDEELRRKDEEHRIVLADKHKEIMELRRRLPKVAEGDV